METGTVHINGAEFAEDDCFGHIQDSSSKKFWCGKITGRDQ